MAPRSRRVGRRPERGAAIVETALVTPVFFLLIFAVLEFGFIFRNHLTIDNTSTQGARAASVAADDVHADFVILRSIEHGFAAWGVEHLDFVVVFHADGPEAAVPDSCKLGPVTDVCNYYRSDEFALGLVDAGGNATPYWGCGVASVDRHWCPTDREVSLSAPAVGSYPSGPSYVGVYVQATHSYLTGFIGDQQVLSDTKIIRIEPSRQ